MPYEFEGETPTSQNRPETRAMVQETLTFEAEPLELDEWSEEIANEGQESTAESKRRQVAPRRSGRPGASMTASPAGAPKPPMEPPPSGRGAGGQGRVSGARRSEMALETPLYEVFDEFEAEATTDFEIVPTSDSRTQIADTRKIPFQWIATIIPTFRHPTTGAEIEMKDQPGSGFLIGPRHILTAAHVLFPPDGPLAHQSPIRVKVTPGHNSTSRPYGEYVSTEYFVRSEWRSSGKNTFDPRYDFAVIRLPSTILKKGLKCWGEAGTNTARYPLSKTWLKGKIVNVCGYPRDKALYTQWIGYDALANPDATQNGTALANVFTHKADTCLGQSGSPVWWYDGKSKRYLVGIHTGHCEGLDGCTRESGAGCLPGSSRWSHNRGVLFSHEVQQQIQAWLK